MPDDWTWKENLDYLAYVASLDQAVCVCHECQERRSPRPAPKVTVLDDGADPA